MQCTRCTGLRVPEIIYEGGSRVLALRCVLCGDVIDRVIVLNRQRRRPPYPNRSQTPIYENHRRKKNRPTMA
jgi:uncharacterized Zn finger protein